MMKEAYEKPLTKLESVELENGFMKASVFEPEDGHDEGVSISGHEIGNSGDYFTDDPNQFGDEKYQWD